MKKLSCFLAVLITLLLAVSGVSAAATNVSYEGTARKFIFETDSTATPTDLFADLKDVMPGDHLTQKITVKNDISNNVKAKIYLRSYYPDDDSQDFLRQLSLTLRLTDQNDMAYMFSSAGTLTSANDGWIELGTLYSGGVVNLALDLDVPTSLGNEYSSRLGHVIWEFKVEEQTPSPDDPTPPKTGDHSIWPVYALTAGSIACVVIMLLITKKKKSEE